MSNPPYRALRIILGIVSVFTAAAGLLLVFTGKPLVMRLLLYPPEAEVSTLLLFVMRPLHPGHNTLAVALHAGHSPTLSRLPDLGSVANPVGTGRRALFPATARDSQRTVLEDNDGLSFAWLARGEFPDSSG